MEGDGLNALELTVVITHLPFPDHQCLCSHGLHFSYDSQVRKEGGERRRCRIGGRGV